MLSRGNSSAATRLRRAKSASSVQTYRSNETLAVDPEIAYQHALTAASVAFEHAHDRGAKLKGAGRDVHTVPGGNPSQPLKHRQSIRFTGAAAVTSGTKSITRRQTGDYKLSLERSKIYSHTPPSRKESSIRTSDSFVTAVPEQSEEYVEHRVSSTPSSFRKLRKTKSMVNPRKGSGLSLASGFSRNKGHSLRPQRNELDGRDSQDSRLRKSLSFLRQSTIPLEAPRNSVDQDKAVQLARDQFVRQLEQQRVEEKTSIVGFARQRKLAKPFRRTVRTSSTNSYGSAIASPAAEALEVPKSNGFGRKARSISISLKSRLKRVFHKASDEDGVVPAQQLSASRSHFGDFTSTFNGNQQRYDTHVPSPDGSTLRRIDSRDSTFRETSAFVNKPSYPGSIRSIESQASAEKEDSRVSSWGTSTISNSIATLPSRENKRLSTINEGSPYQPSSVRRYAGVGPNFTAFTEPIRDFSAGSLYSRLRREIENNERMARQYEYAEQSETKAASASHVANLTPRLSSLGAQQRNSIRNSKSMIFSPTSMERSQQVDGSRDKHLNVQESFDQHSASSSHGAAVSRGTETSLQRRPLREVKSAFFPPSIHLERNSPSPYRQAVHGSEDEATPKKRSTTPVASKSHSNLNDQSPFLQVRNFTDSDSIYSRTTSGNTPRASDSQSTSSDSGDEPGTAVVVSKPMKYEQSFSPSRKRKTSVKSSSDWKSWLSTEVASLERQGGTPRQAQTSLSAGALGHKRENAQIDDDDVDVGSVRGANDAPTQPIAKHQGSSQPNPGVTRQGTSDPMVKSYPLPESETSHANSETSHVRENIPQPKVTKGVSVVKESPPSARTLKSAGELRPQPSHTSLRNRSATSQKQKRFGISLVPSRSGSSDTLRTPSPRILKPNENSGSRYSAEREARLRRMQSSTSPDSRRNQENRPFSSGVRKSSEDVRGKSPRPVLSPTGSTGSVTSRERNQSMIDHFLSNRRRDMRISEESGGDPAFL